eukprot:4516935-Ditylum_brightwellii.AAC.1
MKCKLVDMSKGKFVLVEVFLYGDALMHWLEFKQVDTVRTSNNLDGSDMPPLDMSNPTFRICLQDLKKHYFPKNLAYLQKDYLCSHAEKPNKLNIKNTAA